MYVSRWRQHERFSHWLSGDAPTDWDAGFLEWARWHRLAPFMQAQLPDQRPELAQAWLEAEAEDLARSGWLAEYRSLCEVAGVRLVFFKGVGVAQLAYESPGLRPLGDVDVLVERDALDGAVEVARSLGFRELYADPAIHRYLLEKHYQVPLIHDRFGLLELHFDLYREIRTGWLAQAMRRAVPMSLYGEPSWVLRPEDLFSVLAVHLCYTDGNPVWVWLLDLVLLDALVDPGAVMDVGRDQGTMAALAVVKRISARLWHRQLLGGFDPERELTNLESWAVARSEADDTTFSGSKIRMAQRTRANPRALVGEALRYVWPSNGALALEFGSELPSMPRAAFTFRRMQRTLRAAGAGIAWLERLRGRRATATVDE